MNGFLPAVAIALLLSVGCASHKHHDHNHDHPTTTIAKTDTVNTVCAVNPHDPVSPQYFSIYEGKKVGFCCPDCKAAFDKEPAKYMANLK
jgi:YHS domain-containing protein